jgi:hypothetical protein
VQHCVSAIPEIEGWTWVQAGDYCAGSQIWRACRHTPTCVSVKVVGFPCSLELRVKAVLEQQLQDVCKRLREQRDEREEWTLVRMTCENVGNYFCRSNIAHRVTGGRRVQKTKNCNMKPWNIYCFEFWTLKWCLMSIWMNWFGRSLCWITSNIALSGFEII